MLSERARSSATGSDESTPPPPPPPLITLTIINVHASHVADTRLYLRRETEAAEAAGATIVVKVRSQATKVYRKL